MRLLKVSVMLLVAALTGCNGKQGSALKQEPALKQRPALTPPTEADKRVLKRLNEPIRKLKFDNIKITDVIQFLREVGETNIHVNWVDLSKANLTPPPRTVTIREADIPLDTALALSLDSAFGAGEATFTVAGGVVLVTTHEDAPALAEHIRSRPKGTGSKADRRALKRLNETIRKLPFDDIELEDAIQFLRDVSGLNIYVRWNRLNTVGVTRATTVNIHLHDVTLHTALALCLANTCGTGKAGYRMADGILVISTPEDAAKLARAINAGPAAGKTEADKLVAKRLNEPIREANFDDIELKDVIQFLRKVSDLGMHVQWSRLNSVGVTKDTLGDLHLEQVTLHTLLVLSLADVTEKKTLGYIIKDGAIHISTPEGLKKLREGAAQP